MNELLKVTTNNDRMTLSAKELHEFLEIETPFKKWFGRMCEYGFTSNVDFAEVMDKNVQNPKGGRPSTDYQITIDMAKEISMLQRNEKGKQARQYFIQLEKEWNSPEKVMARALQLADRQIAELQDVNKTLKLENSEMKPKALFADAVSASQDSILIGQLAKLISQNGYKIGQNRLFAWMRENGFLCSKGENYNMPTQKSMDMKLMEIKERTVNNPDGSVRITKTTKVTGKGQIYFVNKFNEALS